jgi:hypothetical protein
LIDAFAREMKTRTPPVLGDAFVKVAVWGNLAGYRADDDWQYTLRAQYAASSARSRSRTKSIETRSNGVTGRRRADGSPRLRRRHHTGD